MTRKTIKRFLTFAILGGLLPVTAATCDPYTGFNFFRDDDSDYYYDDYGCCGDVYVPVCDPFYGCY